MAVALLHTTVFFSGAIVLAYEIAAMRFLQADFGSGVPVTSMVITTFLSALAVGYLLGGWLADRFPRWQVFPLIPLTGGLLVALGRWTIRPVSLWVADREIGGFFGPLVASVLLFFLPTMILAMVSPFAIRLLLRQPDEAGRLSGLVMMISTTGSIVGGLGVLYLMLLLGLRSLVFALGSFLVLLALLGFLLFRQQAR